MLGTYPQIFENIECSNVLCYYYLEFSVEYLAFEWMRGFKHRKCTTLGAGKEKLLCMDSIQLSTRKNELKIRKRPCINPDASDTNALSMNEDGLSDVRHWISEEELPN